MEVLLLLVMGAVNIACFMVGAKVGQTVAKGEEVKAKAMIEQLFNYYMEYTDLLPEKYLRMLEEGEKKERKGKENKGKRRKK